MASTAPGLARRGPRSSVGTVHAGGGDELAAALGHRRGSREYRGVLAGLFFAGVATFAQLYSPQAVLPQISAELSVDAASAALVVSSSTIGLAAGVIPWSLASDRIGRVRAMGIAVIAATTFGMLVPFAPSFGLLLAGRVVEGIALGGVPAIAIAYLSEEVHPESSARAAGTYVAGTSVGGLLGRIVAGPLAELVGWRLAVLAVAVLCAGAAVCFLRLVPASRRFVPHAGGARGVGRLVARHVRSPRLLAIYAQGLLLMGGFVALYNYLGFRLAGPGFRLPPSLASLVFLAYLAGTWASAQAGALASRAGRLPVLVASAALMGLGVALTIADALVPVLVGLVVATVGFFGAHGVASGWSGQAAETGKAQSSALYTLAYYGGSSLFGWLGGIFFARDGWSGTATMVLALVLAAILVALVALRSRRATSRVR